MTMNRSEVKGIMGRHGLRPSKKRGQNFLISDVIREKIIETAGITGADHVLEIGPGIGSLTGRLIDLAGAVTAVEIDSGFSRYLDGGFGDRENFRLVHGDFLKIPILEGITKIVSNLPYNCSTEILFKISGYEVEHVYVMIQKELADRITAGPGHKTYGALTVTLGFYYRPDILFRVSREAFYPRPEVTSSFVRLMRRSAFDLREEDIEIFHLLVKSAFWGRRKTLRTAFTGSPHLDIDRDRVEQILIVAGIDGDTRGEDLNVADYVRLVKAYRKVSG
jgi:16S rRNA (adenine1518-N6/adenine1519-N6)-dimethyltransferase